MNIEFTLLVEFCCCFFFFFQCGCWSVSVGEGEAKNQKTQTKQEKPIQQNDPSEIRLNTHTRTLIQRIPHLYTSIYILICFPPLLALLACLLACLLALFRIQIERYVLPPPQSLSPLYCCSSLAAFLFSFWSAIALVAVVVIVVHRSTYTQI